MIATGFVPDWCNLSNLMLPSLEKNLVEGDPVQAYVERIEVATGSSDPALAGHINAPKVRHLRNGFKSQLAPLTAPLMAFGEPPGLINRTLGPSQHADVSAILSSTGCLFCSEQIIQP